MSSGASQNSLVHQLADEFLARFRQGEKITVDEFCREHSDHADELRGLLTAMAVLEGFPISATDSDSCASSAAVLSEPIPDQIGEYRIIHHIGHGGMGVVYEAEHTSLGRRVALKVLPQQFAGSASARLRFEREARAAARMHHTNIVPIFEVGQADNHLFYAMQLIRGKSLDHTIKEQVALTEQRVNSSSSPPSSASASSAQREFFRSIAKIGLQAAEALEYAHDRGIVHRDIKPSNLIQDQTGVVWLTDFGLAMHDDDGMTKTGEYLGTLRYMSPERFRGECGERADVYSLGLTLYELLTHQPAFATTDQLELIHHIKETEPVRLRSIDPRIPRDLETIITKAIDKEPPRRYQTAAAMADDLRRLLDDQPIVARRATMREQVVLWRRRNPTLAASLAALMSALVVGVAATTWKWREADQQRSLAEQQTMVAQGQREATRWENYRANMATASSALQLLDAESLKTALNACEPEFRGWEWLYFQNQLSRWDVELAGNHDSVPAHTVIGTQFRNQGETLVASALNDRGASRSVLFDVHSGKRIGETKDLYSPLGIHQAASRHHDSELSVLSHSQRYRAMHKAGELRLQRLDPKTNAVTRELMLAEDNGHTALPAFSPDDQFVAYWCVDKRVRVWETATGNLVTILEEPQSRATAIVFSPDGSKLISCGFLNESDWPPKRCELWDTLTGKRLVDLNAENLSRIRTFEFSTDGRTLAVGRDYPSNAIEIWDMGTLSRLAELKTHENSVRSIGLNADASRLAAASFDRTVSVWDLKDFRLLRKFEGPSEMPALTRFNHDQSSLLVIAQSGETRIWNSNSFRLQDAYLTQVLTIADVAVSRDQDLFAAWFDDGTIRVWDIGQKNRSSIRSHESYVYDVEFSPDGKSVASVGWDNTLRIHDIATGEQRISLTSDDLALLRIRYSQYGKRVLATSSNINDIGNIYVWNTDTNRDSNNAPTVFRHTSPHSRIGEGFGATFSPDGQSVISGSSAGKVCIWDLHTRVQKQVAPPSELPPISDVSISPNGQWMLCSGGCLSLWDAKSLDMVAKIGSQEDDAYSATWSADSKLVAAVGTRSKISVWNVDRRERVATLQHGSVVYGAAFNRDGTRLAAACDDNTVRLWDLKTFEQVAVLRQHSSYVHAVDFSPDGTQLVSCSGDHSVRIWDTQPATKRFEK